MNKAINPIDEYEMPDDYSELLAGYDFSKVVRGKYRQSHPNRQKPLVKITEKDGDRYVTISRIEGKGIITPDGNLQVQFLSDVPPGNRSVILTIQKIDDSNNDSLISHQNRNKEGTITTIEASAMITPDGKLTTQVSSEIIPGNYQVFLRIEEPREPTPAEIEESESHLTTPHLRQSLIKTVEN
ncbi:hypothetical protein PN499_24535 [Kamptonema animale CS-326]|jgi:hypothetical protein|uniref:hypothetical protein n=1 Tax=Kamptonema animale TaxID=92934 RepID=UPI00232DA018|nr:hypothetical protein [Kamptonema animale]MDB9514373.1 hypothetical protein [Kamptonema animale CS-326]